MPATRGATLQFIARRSNLILFTIPFISIALHWHIFTRDLVGIHVWRQTQTQNVINNFYREDMNILCPKNNTFIRGTRVLRMEFPLMQWLFACFYRLFGPYIAVSRVLSFVVGMISVAGMYQLCLSVTGSKAAATICAWCFNWSPLFYYYTLNPLPDNMALCYGIWSVVLLYSYIRTGSNASLLGSAVLLCLATLVKLPFIIYGAFMAGYVFLQLRRRQISPAGMRSICIAFVACILPAIVWYAVVIPSWGQNVVLRGLLDQGVRLPDLWLIVWGHFSSVFPELVINYACVLFFMTGIWFVFRHGSKRLQYYPAFAVWGFAVIAYFLFEMNAIGLVHDYYLMPFLPPVFLVITAGACHMLGHSRASRVLAFACLVILPATAFLRINTRWDVTEPGFPAVFYQYKNELRQLTDKSALCVVGNDCTTNVVPYYIDRKCWTFEQDALNDSLISAYIALGARYLFSTSRVDESQSIKAHLGEKIFERDALRVYRLK